MAFVHIHSSSRFNRSPASLQAAANVYFDNSDLVTFTEVNRQPSINAAKNAAGSGWGMVHGHADCHVFFKKSKFKLLKGKSKKLAAPLGNVRKYGAFAVLKETSTGRIFVVSVAHHAKEIEWKLRKNPNNHRVRNWKRSIAAQKAESNRLARKYNAHAVMLVADWNIDWRRPWVRAWFKRWDNKFIGTPNPPTYATIGSGRLIDFTLISGGLSGKGRPMPNDASSDHRPYKEALRWTGDSDPVTPDEPEWWADPWEPNPEVDLDAIDPEPEWEDDENDEYDFDDWVKPEPQPIHGLCG